MKPKSTIPLLLRLKEIDEKYKLKKYEPKYSSTSSESISEKFINNVKNLPIPGSDVVKVNEKSKIHIKMPTTQMEPNIRIKSPDGDLESSTVVVTIFDKSSSSSVKSDTCSTSKITINTRSVKEEMGPAGEGNIITNVNVTLHKLQPDKSTSLSSISEAIASEIQTLKDSDNTINSDDDPVNLEITVENRSSSKDFLQDLPVENDVYRYSDDSFEDVSSYSESETMLKSEVENPLEPFTTETNSDETLSSQKLKKKESSASLREDSNISQSIIEQTSARDMTALSEVESNLSNELSRCIKITQKLEISNSEDISQYSLQYTTPQSTERKSVRHEENKMSNKIKRSSKSSNTEKLIYHVSSEIEEKENSETVEHPVENNFEKKKKNNESELIQLYMNKSAREKDSEDSESVSSIANQKEKRKSKSYERYLKQLSKVSEENRKESQQDREPRNSITNSPYNADHLKVHGLKEIKRRKSISKVRGTKNLSEDVNSTQLRQKKDDLSRNELNNKTECERQSQKDTRAIKFRKIPSKIPQKLQVQKNYIRASYRSSFMLEEEKQRLYQSQKPREPILFKPLNFPNIARFEKTDASINEEVKENNAELHERLYEIQSWLKDQFNLYRDYCKVVSAINKDYVLSSLADVKMLAYELEKSK